MGLSDVAFEAALRGKRPADRWTERRPQRERRKEAEAQRVASAGALSDGTLTYFESKFNLFFFFRGESRRTW